MIILTSFVLIQCGSPQKALERQRYSRAIQLASNKINAQKEVYQNERILDQAGDALVEELVAEYEINKHQSIKHLKISQQKCNRKLKLIQQSNQKTKGRLQQQYDELCKVKQDVDLAVVDYYYKEADQLLHHSVITGTKASARNAHTLFKKSKKVGAHIFYIDVERKIQESLEHGTIYVRAPHQLRINNVFIKRVQEQTNRSCDCNISIRTGVLYIDKSSQKIENTLTQSVVTGQETIRDSCGIVLRYEDIEEDVYATEHIEKISLSASQSLYIDVEAISSECFLSSKRERLCAVEECEEIKYTGDHRARRGKNDQHCAEWSMRSLLQEILEEKAENAAILW